MSVRASVACDAADLRPQLRRKAAADGRRQVWLDESATMIVFATADEVRELAARLTEMAIQHRELERQDLMDEIPQSVVEDVSRQLQERSTSWIPTARVLADDGLLDRRVDL